MGKVKTPTRAQRRARAQATDETLSYWAGRGNAKAKAAVVAKAAAKGAKAGKGGKGK